MRTEAPNRIDPGRHRVSSDRFGDPRIVYLHEHLLERGDKGIVGVLVLRLGAPREITYLQAGRQFFWHPAGWRVPGGAPRDNTCQAVLEARFVGHGPEHGLVEVDDAARHHPRLLRCQEGDRARNLLRLEQAPERLP